VLQVDRLTFEPGVEPTSDRLARVWRAIDELAWDIGARDVTGKGRPARRKKAPPAGQPGPESRRIQLELGNHPDRELQQDWNRLWPDAFLFEVLDRLEPPKEPEVDPAEDLRVLKAL